MTWKLSHISRGILWTRELLTTLFKFWIKNPTKTGAIIDFVLEKLSAFPKFLKRNVFTEQRNSSFEENLEQTASLYKKFRKFDLANKTHITKLEKQLESRSQLLYFIVRSMKPKVVVETGVAAGESSGYILRAMADNNFGKLYSVDLPFQWYVYGDDKLHLDSLPAGKLPGYLVPEDLKKRWVLRMGDTRKVLPELLKELKTIDIFIHDSEHTYETMMFEYMAAWPYLKVNGLLLSDDVHFTSAFSEFCKKVSAKNISFTSLGVAWKSKGR